MAAESTLRSLIDAGRSSKRLDELSSARVIGKIAQQIHAAQQKAGHGKAVGPITPQAITLAPSGEATLTLGATAGLGYSAPEQLDGTGDRRSDVFSLGTVLWEVLTYQRLFDAMNDAAVKLAVQDRAITPPSEINANVPAELSAICMRALSRNPTDRYQSLKAMAVEIEEFLSEAGYEDSDTKIAQYIAATNALPRPASGSQPPPNSAGADLAAKLAGVQPTMTPVGFAAAMHDTPLPPVLPAAKDIRNDKSTLSVSVPPQVKVSTSTAAVVEAKHEEARPVQPPFVAKTETAPGVGGVMRPPATDPPPTQPSILASPPVEAPPQPSILEAPPVTAAIAKEDKPVRIETAETKPVEAIAPVVEPEKPKPANGSVVHVKPGVEPATSTTPTDPEAPAPAILDAKPAPKPDDKPAEAPKESKRAGSQSDASKAASVVSLPRDSKADVLAGWGWGTDKHAAIPEGYAHDDHEYDDAPDRSRKTLMYVIGGGLGLAAIVTIIAIAAGGSSPKSKRKDQAKPVAAQTTEQQQMVEPPPPPEDLTPTAGSGAGSAAVAAPDLGSAAVAATNAGSAGSAVDPNAAAEAEKARLEQEKADKLAAEQAAKDQAAKEKADKLAAEQAAKDQAAKEKADKLSAEKATKDQAAKAKADKLAAEKAAKEQAAKDKAERLAAEKAAAKEKADRLAAEKAAQKSTTTVAKTTTAKTTTPKTTTTRPKTTDTKTTKTVARVDDNLPPATKTDPEVAYRQGLQAFARGDTTAALASLRQSLAANKNYAPTWRGLGLVFEKMGEKDQARSAYKRYLQLAPTAGDSEIIRGRLERLGS